MKVLQCTTYPSNTTSITEFTLPGGFTALCSCNRLSAALKRALQSDSSRSLELKVVIISQSMMRIAELDKLPRHWQWSILRWPTYFALLS